jgi:hypothetical protein
MKKLLSGLLVVFIMILSAVIAGLITYFVFSRNENLYTNDILVNIVFYGIAFLIFFILMMLCRSWLGIK